MTENLKDIVSLFDISEKATEVKPMGEGMINDTYKVFVEGFEKPIYVLQRINNAVFQNVDMLQDNIEKITNHIRMKGKNTLKFFRTKKSDKSYYFDGNKYWRLMLYVTDSTTFQTINTEYSYLAGKSFGEFENLLSDMKEPIGEIIPNFHNIEFRLQQLHDAVKEDKVGRVELPEIKYYINEIEKRVNKMTLGERLFREGKLPKRICHCDTKVNNMLFDKNGEVLCIIDLDTTMPSFVFSDYGDFLRDAANTGTEDDPNLDNINFNMEIFEAFTKGYLEGTKNFLLPIEKENLSYAVLLFPYMQTVRFLTDYINGDSYYKIKYPEHNLIRTRAQWRLFEKVEEKEDLLRKYILTQDL